MQNIAYLLGFSSLSIYHCRPVWLRFWHVKTICKNIINRFLRLFGKMTNVCSVGMASYVWWTRTATIWIITDPRCGFGVHAMWPNLSYIWISNGIYGHLSNRPSPLTADVERKKCGLFLYAQHLYANKRMRGLSLSFHFFFSFQAKTISTSTFGDN